MQHHANAAPTVSDCSHTTLSYKFHLFKRQQNRNQSLHDDLLLTTEKNIPLQLAREATMDMKCQ